MEEGSEAARIYLTSEMLGGTKSEANAKILNSRAATIS